MKLKSLLKEIENPQRINTIFKVDEAKRTVVCRIITINDMEQRLAKYNLIDGDYDGILDIREYVGIAKCALEDEWNESYGKHLAEFRAASARKGDVNREIDEYKKSIMNSLELLDRFGKLKEVKYPKG